MAARSGSPSLVEERDGTIRVLIVDDHAIFRHGLAAVLREAGRIAVVGEASDGLEGVRLARRLRPHVVLMDAEMPGMNGAVAAAMIHNELPETRVVMLSMYQDDRHVFESLRAGAVAYVLKDDSPEDLIRAIHAVHGGHSLLSPPVAAQVVRRVRAMAEQHPAGPAGAAVLSPREQEVLQLVRRGFRNREIAEALSVSIPTVKAHIRSILRKLNLRSRTEAALLPPEPPAAP